MTREKAIQLFAEKKMRSFTSSEREEELSELMLCNWSSTDGWDLLSEELKIEFSNGKFKDDYSSNRYDEILLFKIKDKIKGVTNDYIKEYINIKIITGAPFQLETCPCCGYRTLEARYAFEICTVCWWEDDGQDNDNSDIIWTGANDVTLTNARFNFIVYRIYNPERTDLFEFQEESKMYLKHRTFELKENVILEEETNWKRKVPNIN